MLTASDRQSLANAPLEHLRRESATWERREAKFRRLIVGENPLVSDIVAKAREGAEACSTVRAEIDAEIQRRGAGFRCPLCNRILADDEIDRSLCGKCERRLDDDVA